MTTADCKYEYPSVISLTKGHERYIFIYTSTSRAECLRMLGRFASNPELSFTWYEAAVLSQRMREAEEKRR